MILTTKKLRTSRGRPNGVITRELGLKLREKKWEVKIVKKN